MSRYRHPSQIDEIIIHCSATPNGRWQTVDDIDQWHGERTPPFQRSPGLMRYQAPRLKHIGYHLVIYTTGAVVSARGLNETGAHAIGHNRRAIGICLIGDDQFTTEQWLSLKFNVAGLKSRFPQSQIIGHNEINQYKSCPGFDVQQWLAGDMKPLHNHILESADE